MKRRGPRTGREPRPLPAQEKYLTTCVHYDRLLSAGKLLGPGRQGTLEAKRR